MKRFVWAVLPGIVALLAGCGKPAATAPAPAAPAASIFMVPTAAQGKLPTIKLWLGKEEVQAEMALSPIQQATGMMFRTNLDENCGMIFVRPQPERASFWMTNCPLPLSAAYIDTDGAILETHELKANDPTPVVSKNADVQFVLEMSQGWFDRHHIESGTLITTEHGNLPKVFLRRR